MAYEIVIAPLALHDIQDAIDYYDKKQYGLGERFENSLHKELTKLERTPHFQLRYDKVHCLPMKKFPFMIHYTIDSNTRQVIIQAVFHTSLYPGRWKER
ncbi:MAG: type II toxin-antitoxin system RelE/ParE family toxin [Bacteroidales bacterium]|nr:type II toxin-antitoxin system RelE/ParE family toxin [Bacteroidales bacterium]